LFAGCLVATLGALTRQNTIIIPITAAVLLLLEKRWREQALWWVGVLLPLAVCLGAHYWLQGRKDAVPRELSMPEYWYLYLLFPFVVIHFLGLFALPVLAATRGAAGSWKIFLLTLGAMAVAAGLVYRKLDQSLFPYLDVWLPESYHLQGYVPLMLRSDGLRLALTVGGCIGGAGLITRLVGVARMGFRPDPLLVFSALQLPLLLLSPVLYDRYLFILIPGALYVSILGASQVGFRWKLGTAVLLVFGVVSVGVVHDWLSMNAARWELGRRALARHVHPNQIEGGLEWDGWFSPIPSEWKPTQHGRSKRRPVEVRGLALIFTQMCFPRMEAAYAISCVPPPTTLVVEDRQLYTLWLVPGERSLYFVRMTSTFKEFGINLYELR
jgi:hypothetical protein